MRVKYSQKSVDYLKNSLKNQFLIEDLSKDNFLNFSKQKDLFLEIGPGKGKFIIELAKKYPDYNFLVVEINKTIAGYCLKAIDRSELTNVKLVADDFYKIVDCLEPNSIDGIFLNFSDPWPKKRHTKRRLTSDNFFKAYYKILKLNHNIYIKSDNKPFFDYSYDQALKFKYSVLSLCEDYKDDDEFDSVTEYEEKFFNKGIKINRMILKKSEDTIDEIE
ncbi:MAG: tRNA (guanosine(46)-N7)-methyltransferase TrmB [Candidatus Onthovivens sp.]|nr:tRNA (guanosine(46)-N7)-methyltransferase TrmB [Candidatus Onthovivens sp.]